MNQPNQVEKVGVCPHCGGNVYIILGNQKPFAVTCSRRNHKFGEYDSRRAARKTFQKEWSTLQETQNAKTTE